MSDPLEDAKMRCEWGKHHIADLKQRILSFIKADPYIHFVEYHSHGVGVFQKIKIKPFPKEWALITSDAVVSLRSALDNAVHAILGVPKKVRRRQAKFPFADSETEFKTGTVFQYFPDDIKPLFGRFKPYKGGNNLLWALNRVCNAEKHETLVSHFLGCRTQTQTIIPSKILKATNLPILDRSKNEVIVAIIHSGETIKYDGELLFAVTFGEIEFVKGEPVIATLNQMVSTVESILANLEAEARRLRYI